MDSMFNLAEHAGLLVAILGGLFSLVWLLLLNLRRSDIRRIDIQRDALDRIELKIDRFSEELGKVIGETGEYKTRLDRLDMACEWAKTAYEALSRKAQDAEIVATKVSAEAVSEFRVIEKRLDQLHSDYTSLSVLVREHVGDIAAIKKILNGGAKRVR